jgi:sugar lactone lactonase YvrE
MLVRLDSESGIVWFGAPSGTLKPGSAVVIAFPGQQEIHLASNGDGSFLYRFAGDENSMFKVSWYEFSGTQHEYWIQVTNPLDDLSTHVGVTGLYCNRLYAEGNYVWVVNSGDDELAPYDPNSLEKLDFPVLTPAQSNPWEAEFYSPSNGLITTLFNGVFWFDTSIGSLDQIDTSGHRDFASPNGVTITGSDGWVTNTNPLGYFPTTHGPGWISDIDLGSRKVIWELDTPWLNPQYIINDGNYIYISCTGTVDFTPPDYLATAMTDGGVMVLDPGSHEVVKSFDLGLCAPGVMALSPDNKYLYIGSGVAAWIFRIDLVNGKILNGLSNPIVVSDYPGSYIPFLTVNENGLIATASFNDDVIRFIDSYTGQLDPYPFFEPVNLHTNDPDAFWGPQDAVFTERGVQSGLLFITTIDSAFHWLEI